MKKLVIVLASLLIGASAFAQDDWQEQPEYGYKQTGYQSDLKFGGYIIGGYKFSDKAGANGGPGFNARLIRLYMDGTIYNDFKYRLQLQVNGGAPHVKDFYLEWAKWTEFSVKIGQFKRAFTFENPMNPWDVGVGDYSFLVSKFAGFGDRLGEANMGGRDIGLQIQGDFLPIGDDQHRFIHYQLGVYNGQGINMADANKEKDLIGTIQFQPFKGLYLGGFLWRGSWHTTNATGDPVDLARRRVALGAKFDMDNWTVRTEYAQALASEVSQSGAASAFYFTAGIPLEDWLKFYVKYDYFADTASHHMYSGCANFRLHKNLDFQLEYRRHQDNHIASPGYDEIWFMTYVRF